MILIMMGAAIYAASFQAAAAAEPRQKLVACLKNAGEEALKEKMPKDAFKPFAKTHCMVQVSTFRQSSVAFDIKLGAPRSRAEADAEAQIDDYLDRAVDRYDLMVNPGG